MYEMTEPCPYCGEPQYVDDFTITSLWLCDRCDSTYWLRWAYKAEGDTVVKYGFFVKLKVSGCCGG